MGRFYCGRCSKISEYTNSAKFCKACGRILCCGEYCKEHNAEEYKSLIIKWISRCKSPFVEGAGYAYNCFFCGWFEPEHDPDCTFVKLKALMDLE